MKSIFRTLLAGAAAFAFGASATAQPAFIKYNEAVTVVGGKRLVELPPVNKMFTIRKPGTSDVHYGVETEQGLMDCGVPFLHKDACIPTNYGKVQAARGWVVKVKGDWQVCAYRDAPRECQFFNGARKGRPMTLLPHVWE